MHSLLHLLQSHLWLLETIRQCVWLLFLAVVFMPLEQVFAVRRRRFLTPRLAGDVAFYFVSAMVPSLLLTPVLGIVTWLANRYVPAGYFAAVNAMPLWLRAVAALGVAEIGFYWGHRWTHQIPFLWRFHAVHHAPTELYYLISARAHPLDHVVTRLCGFIPVYVLGILTPLTPSGGVMSALLVLALTLWGFVIHANLRWRFGLLEWLIATPAFHHWHHTAPEPRDRNFAPMLPLIDWLFGTLYLPKQFPSAYGIDEKLPRSVLGQLAYPLIGAEPGETDS